MKINLVNSGIFPIKYDILGNLIDSKLDTGLNISGCIQGEGKLVGVPSLFIRTSGCNLRCAWVCDTVGDVCDTPYSSWKADQNLMEINDVIQIVKNNIDNINHVVITGGEPMLQIKPMIELCTKLKKLNLHITLETNGTIFDDELGNLIDLYSISPKLSNSIPFVPNLRETGYEYNDKRALRHQKIRKNLRVLQAFIDSCYFLKEITDTPDYNNRNTTKDIQLKFVINNYADINEIKTDFLHYLKGIKTDDILLMPMGSTREKLSESILITMTECIKNNWRYTPRLHTDIFNNKRNV